MRRSKKRVVKQEPRKDSKSKRVNFDNERVPKFKKDMEAVDETIRSKTNDPSWYASNAELMRSAASLPFSPVVGRPLPFVKSAELGAGDGASVPGVFVLSWSPSIPSVGNNAVNQAANSIYSFTVHANSRNQSYDAPDEMLLILAGAQVFSAIALGVRAFGVMRRYYQEDMYTPAALLTAMGFSPDDLQANYSKMWFDLNELIARTQQIWIPNTMPVIERWFWLNSNIYKDGDSVKSQYYMFTPAVFYSYNDAAGRLDPNLWYGTPANDYTTSLQMKVQHTWADYLTLVNKMINNLLGSQDRGIIFGDILKAYGADKLYTISSIGPDYMIEPTYDREVLTQIENATTCMFIPSYIFQKNGFIYQNFKEQLTGPGISSQARYYVKPVAPNQQVLNFHQKEVPTPEQIMVATRLKALGQVGAQFLDDSKAIAPAQCGTEIVVTMGYLAYTYAEGVATLNVYNYQQYFYQYTPQSTGSSTETEKTNLSVTSLLSVLNSEPSFDWAPWVYIVQPAPTTTSAVTATGTVSGNDTVFAYGDWDNYTFLTESELSKMHTTAVYSEFGVPSNI